MARSWYISLDGFLCFQLIFYSVSLDVLRFATVFSAPVRSQEPVVAVNKFSRILYRLDGLFFCLNCFAALYSLGIGVSQCCVWNGILLSIINIIYAW